MQYFILNLFFYSYYFSFHLYLFISMTYMYSATEGQGKYLPDHLWLSYFSSLISCWILSLERHNALTNPGHGTKFVTTWW